MDECFPGTRVEDLIWLFSLSESEIDMLISLKLLILQRAKMIGDSELATKFDLKMLRAIDDVFHVRPIVQGSADLPVQVDWYGLGFGSKVALDGDCLKSPAVNLGVLSGGFVLMKHIKSQVQGSSIVSDITKSGALLDASNLLKWDSGNDANIEEISALSSCIGVDLEKFWGKHVSLASKGKRKRQKV